MNLAQDGWAKIRTQGFRRDQFHAPVEQIFQKISQVNEVGERLATRLKIHQHVHVAVRARLTASARAEQSDAPDTEASQFGAVGFEFLEKFVVLDWPRCSAV